MIFGDVTILIIYYISLNCSDGLCQKMFLPSVGVEGILRLAWLVLTPMIDVHLSGDWVTFTQCLSDEHFLLNLES